MHNRTILGVSYLIGPPEDVVNEGLSAGLVVIPSAPVITRMEEDEAHREAVLHADMAIADSGLMVLLWRLFSREHLVRVSGLEYLRRLLEYSDLRQSGAVAWVMPTVAARDQNLTWLRSVGHQTTPADCYLAPTYPASGELADQQLVSWIHERRPRHLIIALGGGVQERLGWYLKQNVDYKLGIHCVGAAIGFLSGEQVNIPNWADRFYLGWLFRSLRSPSRFFPRYFKALRLIPLVWRYRSRLPPTYSK